MGRGSDSCRCGVLFSSHVLNRELFPRHPTYEEGNCWEKETHYGGQPRARKKGFGKRVKSHFIPPPGGLGSDKRVRPAEDMSASLTGGLAFSQAGNCGLVFLLGDGQGVIVKSPEAQGKRKLGWRGGERGLGGRVAEVDRVGSGQELALKAQPIPLAEYRARGKEEYRGRGKEEVGVGEGN